MKAPKHFTSLALAGGLAFAGTVQAQPVTGTPYLSNMSISTLLTPPSATYASWSGAAGLSSTLTGLRAQNAGYGSLYYVLPGPQVQTINATATEVQLTLSVGGNAADYNWIGTPFILNDDSGSYNYGGLYSGSGNPGNPPTVTWNGNIATWTLPLQAAQQAAVATGNDHIYSFNLQLDPASLINGRSDYEVTFNSLQMITVPEPASLALVGFGAALLALRRRSV